MKADKQAPPIFQKKDACVAFQAADLLAYELLKRYRDVSSASAREPRSVLLSLSEIPRSFAAGRPVWGMYTENDLNILRQNVEEIMQGKVPHA